MEDENVPVAILAAADANGRARDGFCDFCRKRGMDEFENDGFRAGLIEGFGIGQEAIGLGVALALDVVAAFLDDPLRKHAEVANHANLLGDDGSKHREDFRAALDFDKIRTGLAQKAGVYHRELRRGATPGRKVGGDECIFRPTGHGTRVVDHVGHGYLRGIGLAENDHPERIADEQKIKSAAIKQTRRRVVVGCQPREAAAGGFGCADRSRFHREAEY